MQIILFQPQIPQNTGNIVRSCSVTGTSLALVEPLGFSLHNRWLKRAGLDYWEGVQVEIISDLEAYLHKSPSNFYFYSSKATKRYTDVKHKSNDLLIFGSETEGLPQHFSEKWSEQFAKIPMISGVRCLNLATSVGIVLYEAWRQLNFEF